MNDCLSLPFRQGVGGTRILSGWETLWAALGEGEAEGYPTGGGRGWEPASVPAQQWATEGRSALWYRTRLPRPDHRGRVLLRVGGAFLATHVWLNGRLLGSHYGYFGPFGFDITPFLRDDNLLAICCESPIETDLPRKRHVMGIFNDGDARPYPSGAWFSLPPEYRWEVPVGLWRPVELEYLGPVAVDWLALRPRLEAGDGRLEIEAHLRNLDGRAMAGELLVELYGPGAAGYGGAAQMVRLRREYILGGAADQTVGMALSVPGARPWWPWRLGDQPLYRAVLKVQVADADSSHVEEHFGFREAAVRAGHDGWSISLNGRSLFLRGADYAPGLRLDQLTEDLFERDLRLAREANLDALRVHGHVLPDTFYRKADEAGVLVMADFPLTLSYAYHAGAEDARFFETAVREQVPEMVHLLQNRTSVLMWVAHDEPPWIPASASLADVHAVRQNYTIDQEIKASFERLDPTRSALAASGELDMHLWLGWREGSWREFAEVQPGFVSEFGAQALPTWGSPAWDSLGARWPVTGEDPDWLYAGFQPTAWAEHGAGLPTDWESLEEYIQAGQEYQAHLLSYAVDQLRKRKLDPCWGVFVYQLTDTFPGVGYGLVDDARVPRLALQTVRDAFAPTRVIIDPVGFTPIQPWGFGWPVGEAVSVRLLVVNDDPSLSGRARVRWSVWRERALARSGKGRLRDAVRRKSYSGSAELNLPALDEPAMVVTSVSLPLEAEGDYQMEAELRVPGRPAVPANLGFRVSERLDSARRPPLLPAYLAERLVDRRSLRPYPEGLRFVLRNRTRPAVLAGLDGLKLNGRRLEGRILVETESGQVALPGRLELPLDRDLQLLVELGRPLQAGRHQLELGLTVPGVARGRVRISDALGTENPTSAE